MRHSLAWLALAAVACTPRASSEPAAQPPHAAVVDVPAPTEEAPTAPGDDAGMPHTTDERKSPAQPGMTTDAGAGVSFAGKFRFGTGDAGVIFDGSVAFGGGSSLTKLSPELVVHSALWVPSPGPSGHALLLFESMADCGTRTAHHITLGMDWKRGAKSTFMNLSITNGHSEHYKGRIEVLDAPTAPGSTGAIRLDPIPDGNVRGGRVPVHVCP